MELSELRDKVLTIFNVPIGQLRDALMQSVTEYNTDIMDRFCDIVKQDLSIDHLQMIYQYYLADRKEKKQDYTPKCLAELMGKLAGESETLIDMCAGSGALTIQSWVENKNRSFILYELDENVIPFLLFNLSLRNIQATIIRSDVLSGEVFDMWTIKKGEKYGKVFNIQSTV